MSVIIIVYMPPPPHTADAGGCPECSLRLNQSVATVSVALLIKYYRIASNFRWCTFSNLLNILFKYSYSSG